MPKESLQDIDLINYICISLQENDGDTKFPIETAEYRTYAANAYEALESLVKTLPKNAREKILNWYDQGKASDFQMIIQKDYFKAGFRRGLQIALEAFGPSVAQKGGSVI